MSTAELDLASLGVQTFAPIQYGAVWDPGQRLA